MKIICPICQKELIKKDNSLVCDNKHNFDIAKEGYINLYLNSSKNSGDDKEMINARELFLDKDYYLFLKEEINNIIKIYRLSSLVDLACGEGYYTSYFDVEEKYGIDLSKQALKKASKQDKKTTYILSSIFKTPLISHGFDGVLTCFAPIAIDEVKRLLKKGGIFILVRPGKKHLYELKEKIYDNAYLNEVDALTFDGLKEVASYQIEKKCLVEKDDIINLFTMTPYYHKTSLKDKEKLNSLSSLELSFEFQINIFKC